MALRTRSAALRAASAPRAPGAGEDEQEFLTGHPAHHVGLAQRAFHQFRHELQHLVAGGMAMLVVDALEEVDVQHRHRKADAVAAMALTFLGQGRRQPRMALVELQVQGHAGDVHAGRLGQGPQQEQAAEELPDRRFLGDQQLAAVGMITTTVKSMSARKSGSSHATPRTRASADPAWNMTRRGFSRPPAPWRRTTQAPPPATQVPTPMNAVTEPQCPTPCRHSKARKAASIQ